MTEHGGCLASGAEGSGGVGDRAQSAAGGDVEGGVIPGIVRILENRKQLGGAPCPSGPGIWVVWKPWAGQAARGPGVENAPPGSGPSLYGRQQQAQSPGLWNDNKKHNYSSPN